MVHFDPMAVVAVMAAISGPTMFLRGLRELRLRRLIENTPASHIRSVAMGLAEINGTARRCNGLVAPLSEKPCAYWEVDISVPGRQKGSWQIIHRGASGHPFDVDDGTGIAKVFPHGAQCRLVEGWSEQCLGAAVPPAYGTYMEQNGVTRRPFWRIETFRFRERAIEEGQHVFILGSAEPRSQALDISHAETFTATGTDAEPARGRVPAPDPPVAVIRQGTNDRTYIISLESERMLTTSLQLIQIIHLAVGPLITVFGMGYWLLAFAPGATP